MFDDNGDGTVDAAELRAVLRALGVEMSHEQVTEVIATIDADSSDVIEFPEFVTLMRKLERGEIDVGDSQLAQAVMGSKCAVAIRQEVKAIDDDPIPGCSVMVLKKPITPPSCEVTIKGPVGSPYEGFYIKLTMSLPDSYPFSPPKVRFMHRIMHINFDMMLDGSCSIPQLLRLWDGGWDLRMLITYVRDLLSFGDTRLLPKNVREKYGFEGFPGEIGGGVMAVHERVDSMDEAAVIEAIQDGDGGVGEVGSIDEGGGEEQSEDESGQIIDSGDERSYGSLKITLETGASSFNPAAQEAELVARKEQLPHDVAAHTVNNVIHKAVHGADDILLEVDGSSVGSGGSGLGSQQQRGGMIDKALANRRNFQGDRDSSSSSSSRNAAIPIIQFIDPYKMANRPPYKVERSRLEDDLRDSGEKHGGSFLPRCVEMFVERRAKFDNEARNFCIRECAVVGKRVDERTQTFC